MFELSVILPFIISVLVLIVILKLISFPLKIIIRLVVNALIGGVILYLINMFGASIGLTIDINWFTAVITGIFGIPGVIFLIILQFLI